MISESASLYFSAFMTLRYAVPVLTISVKPVMMT